MDLTRAAQDPYPREPVGAAILRSPEQMAKRAVDARADVYALGTILYELLTLTRPSPMLNVRRLEMSGGIG